MSSADQPYAFLNERERKLRVLFITSPFPPANRPGTPRTWNIAAALARNGWDVAVLTLDPQQWTARDDEAAAEARLEALGITRIAVRNPWPWLTGGLHQTRIGGASLIGRVIRRISSTLQVEPEIGFVRAAESAAEVFREDDFDVVLASVPPFALAPVAMRVARRLRIPYVIDYRDLWSLNPMRTNQTRHARVEQEVLQGAGAVTIVSPSAASLLTHRFGVQGKVEVLTNGFLREDIGSVTPKRFGHFAIVYAGAFYAPKRSITPLFEALVRLDARGGLARDWRFHYYGHQYAYVEAAADQAGLSRSRVVCHGSVTRGEALSAIAGADLVIVITSVFDEGDAADRGVVTGKVFEAIALKRQMLAIAPRNSDIEPIIAAAGRGSVFQGSNLEGIARHIERVAIDPVGGAAGDPSAFEWTQLGRRLSDIVTRAAARGN